MQVPLRQIQALMPVKRLFLFFRRNPMMGLVGRYRRLDREAAALSSSSRLASKARSSSREVSATPASASRSSSKAASSSRSSSKARSPSRSASKVPPQVEASTKDRSSSKTRQASEAADERQAEVKSVVGNASLKAPPRKKKGNGLRKKASTNKYVRTPSVSPPRRTKSSKGDGRPSRSPSKASDKRKKVREK